MNKNQLLNRLHQFVGAHYSSCEAAKCLGISQPYLSLIRSGKRPIPDSIANALGFKPIINYIPI